MKANFNPISSLPEPLDEFKLQSKPNCAQFSKPLRNRLALVFSEFIENLLVNISSKQKMNKKIYIDLSYTH